MYSRHLATMTLAVTLAVTALHVNAFDPQATKFYEDAERRLSRDDVAGAIIQLNNALQRDPNMLAAHVLLGQARLRNGDAAGAETSFESALGLGVDRAELALPLAQAYSAQGKFELLLERISPAGQPSQAQVQLLILRGNAQLELGDAAAGLRTLDQARALDPRSTAVHLAQGEVLLRTGQTAQAMAAADEVIKLDPNASAAWYLRGTAAQAMGNLQPALSDYAKALASILATWTLRWRTRDC